jgi:hypothetical protein
MANEIRIGAIIDASQIPGGLDALISALAEARSNYNSTSVESAASLARLKQAHKDLDKAGDDTRAAAQSNLGQISSVYAATDGQAQSLRATIEALEIQLAAYGISVKQAAAATGQLGQAQAIGASYASNMAASTAQAAMSATQMGAAMAAAAATVPTAMGGIMAGAAAAGAAANAAVPPIQQLGAASASASIPIFRIYALLALVRRGLDELDKFRQAEVDLGAFADASGIAAEKIAQLEDAMNLLGGNGDQVPQILLRLGRAMEQAQRGSKVAADEIRRFGIGGMTDPIEALLRISDVIHNTSDKFEALETASRLVGMGIKNIEGPLSEGSDALRKAMVDSTDLAAAQAAGIDPARELTRVEHELGAAFTTVGVDVLPYVTGAFKVAASVMSGFALDIKVVTDSMIAGWLAAGDVVESLGNAMQDAANNKWGKAAADIKAGMAFAKIEWAEYKKTVASDVADNQKFLDALWKPKPQAKPEGGDKPFPKVGDPNANKKAEDVLRKADQEAFADLQANHQLTIQEEISFWEGRLKVEADYADRVREIKRTLGHEYQALDRQEYSLREKEARDGAKRIMEAINAGSEDAQTSGGKRGELSFLTGQADKLANDVVGGSLAAGIAYEEVMKKIPAVTREAWAEAEEATKTALQRQFEAINDNGKISLAEQKEFWAQAALSADSGSKAEAYAFKEWEKAGKDLADQLRKVNVELANLKSAADAAASIHAINLQELGAKGQQETRLFPTTPQERVGDARQQIGFDQQKGKVQQQEQTEKFNTAADKASLTGDAQDYEKAMAESNKLTAVIQANDLKLKTDQNALSKAIVQPWQQAFSTISQGFEKSFGDMLLHGKSFGAGMVQMYQNLAQQAINYVIGMGEKWVEEHILMGLVSKIFHTQQVTDTTAATTAATAVHTAANVVMATSDAGLAAAGAFAFYSAIDPPVAPAMAAVYYAEGMGFAALSAERGAILPNANSLVLAHPEEMILPRPISLGIQQMIASGGANPGQHRPSNVTHNYGGVTNNVKSGASASDIGRESYASLRRFARDQHTRF